MLAATGPKLGGSGSGSTFAVGAEIDESLGGTFASIGEITVDCSSMMFPSLPCDEKVFEFLLDAGGDTCV